MTPEETEAAVATDDRHLGLDNDRQATAVTVQVKVLAPAALNDG